MLQCNDPPDEPSSNDAWLTRMVERAQAGEQAAFAILFHHYNAKICTYLTRLVDNDELACDLAQDTFVKVWQCLPMMRDTAKFKAWLYKIATNQAYLYLRRKRLPCESLSAAMHLTTEGPDRQFEEAEFIRSILAHLPLQQRICLLLYIEGFTYREIAELVKITEKHVSVQISRAREHSRQISQYRKGEKVQ